MLRYTVLGLSHNELMTRTNSVPMSSVANIVQTDPDSTYDEKCLPGILKRWSHETCQGRKKETEEKQKKNRRKLSAFYQFCFTYKSNIRMVRKKNAYRMGLEKGTNLAGVRRPGHALIHHLKINYEI